MLKRLLLLATLAFSVASTTPVRDLPEPPCYPCTR
jgi:hypothetical protein